MTDEEKAKEYAIIVYKNLIRDKVNPLDKIVLNEGNIEQAYLDGLEEGRKDGFDEGYKKATERAYERQQDLTDTYIKDGDKIKQLEKENAELKGQRNRLIEILNRIDNCKHMDFEDYGVGVMEILNDEGRGFWNNWE